MTPLGRIMRSSPVRRRAIAPEQREPFGGNTLHIALISGDDGKSRLQTTEGHPYSVFEPIPLWEATKAPDASVTLSADFLELPSTRPVPDAADSVHEQQRRPS
jgi:hypothetical protein